MAHPRTTTPKGSTTVKLSIYHNTTKDEQGRLLGMVDGYEPGHLLTKVYELDARDGAHWAAALAYAYDVFNVGHEATPPNRDAVGYRARDNRSLSIGDVVEIEGTWYACMPVGWGEIPTPEPAQLVDKLMHGTTPAAWDITRCTASFVVGGQLRTCGRVLDRDGACFNADRHVKGGAA